MQKKEPATFRGSLTHLLSTGVVDEVYDGADGILPQGLAQDDLVDDVEQEDGQSSTCSAQHATYPKSNK